MDRTAAAKHLEQTAALQDANAAAALRLTARVLRGELTVDGVVPAAIDRTDVHWSHPVIKLGLAAQPLPRIGRQLAAKGAGDDVVGEVSAVHAALVAAKADPKVRAALDAAADEAAAQAREHAAGTHAALAAQDAR